MSKPNFPKWFTLLSPPVREAVVKNARDMGFEADAMDAFVADVFTIAHHTPKGYFIKLSKVKPEPLKLELEPEMLPLAAGGGIE